MFQNHHHLKILAEERHRELLAQSRLVKQREELDRQRVKLGLNWSLSRIIRSVLEPITHPILVTQPDISPPECQTQPNCQVC